MINSDEQFGHDPALHVSARLSSALLSSVPHVSVPPSACSADLLTVSIVLCITSLIYRYNTSYIRHYTGDSGNMLCSPVVNLLQNSSEHYSVIKGKSGDHSLVLTRWDILSNLLANVCDCLMLLYRAALFSDAAPGGGAETCGEELSRA